MEFPYQHRAPLLIGTLRIACRMPVLLVAAVLLLSGTSLGQTKPEVADRVAAVVEEDPITWTDVTWFARFRGIPVPGDREEREAFFTDILDQLINQSLVVKESAKTPFVQVTETELEEYLSNYRRSLGGEEQLQARLGELGFGPQELREILRRRIILNKFIQVRFEPFVIVLPDEVEAYYQEEYVPELRDQGQEPPPISLVEETIRQILTVEKTTRQLEAWIHSVRQRYDVRVLLFRSPTTAPNLPSQLLDEVRISSSPVSETPSSNPE